MADIGRAADVIAEAFSDDPLCAFMLPFRRTRRTTLRKFFRAYSELAIKNGRAYGVGEPLEAVAYWKAPEEGDLSVSARDLALFLPVLLSFYPIGYLRAKAALERQDALHEKHASEPHFYLDNLGVLPTARGRGLSSSLIRPFLQKADDQGVAAYTDTYSRANIPIYEHFGFQCVEGSAIDRTGLTVWALRRAAQG